MKTQTFWIILGAIFLLFSCKKDVSSMYDSEDTFSFRERNQNVSVSTQTKSFHIAAKLGEALAYNIKREIKIIPELTSAKEGEHYILPDELIFCFTAGSLNSEIEIPIVFEYISKPVKIVFTNRYKSVEKNYPGVIDTLTVTLLPAITNK